MPLRVYPKVPFHPNFSIKAQILLTQLISKDEDCPAAVAAGVPAIDADAAPGVSQLHHRVQAWAAGAAGVQVDVLEANVAGAHRLLEVALADVPGNACMPSMT